MTDYSHLDALQLRLSNERQRHADWPHALRAVWIAQIEQEIAREREHLGLIDYEVTDDELLAALYDPQNQPE